MHANSGDTSGDHSRVVGYGAVIFYDHLLGQADPPDDAAAALSPAEKSELLKIARESVESYVRTGKAPQITTKDPRLNETQGAFVTLTEHGALRGCIGNIIGREPLSATVRDMAVAAASHDPRFSPVAAAELKDISIEISVLSAPRRVKDASQIQLGRHGVIVNRGGHQGVFLPQVARETGWNKEEFLSELCAQKAGLPPDAWKDPKTALYVFTADVFAEK
ncbi:MAG: AmmeMemoRadiSam system protein A [Candidatus Omnitrophica bacterium]|nr:AmmeMemoRadiSam system protein A [Candidatus Omnitrophota bacterium]